MGKKPLTGPCGYNDFSVGLSESKGYVGMSNNRRHSMNTRLELLADGVKNLAACCCPYLRLYKVSHFDSEHKWVEEEVMAYFSKDAAKRLGLKAGYNCCVSRIIRRRKL